MRGERGGRGDERREGMRWRGERGGRGDEVEGREGNGEGNGGINIVLDILI